MSTSRGSTIVQRRGFSVVNYELRTETYCSCYFSGMFSAVHYFRKTMFAQGVCVCVRHFFHTLSHRKVLALAECIALPSTGRAAAESRKQCEQSVIFTF